jgi:5-methylcytosine-specific restriction endonuclease McrA
LADGIITEDMPLSVVQQVQLAAEYHLAGKRNDADVMLRSIDHDALRRERADFMARIPPRNPAIQPIIRERRTQPEIKAQLAMFIRDRFSCRYCGKRTIFTPILRLLSRLYPDALPYHPNWKFGAGHPIYWTHSASCEHVVPIARGGTSAPDNLVTTCYLCNDAKSSALIQELGWTLQPPSTAYWDGLTTLYARLYLSCPDVQRTEYFKQWQQALREAEAKR